MYGLVLLVHLLSATIWTGGHLILTFALLPKALKDRSSQEISRFEAYYERIGIPALITQVVTGTWLAYRLVSDVRLWFDLSAPVSRLISLKLSLLLITVLLALSTRLRILPNVTEKSLGPLAIHIVLVTIVSVVFVVVGLSFRTGWLY